MPTTIIDCDIAEAEVPGGLLVLHYTGRVHPPAYFLIARDAGGGETDREGPFADEPEAMDAAEARHGPLRWRVGRTE